MKNHFNFYNSHLIISVLIVIPVALIYGFNPNFLFDVNVNTIDEANIFKAIMGLYIAFASLWVLGILDANYWKTATICNLLFMFGLAFGRIISLITDGLPSSIFVLGTLAEMGLGIYTYWIFRKSIV